MNQSSNHDVNHCLNRRHFVGSGAMSIGAFGLAWLLKQDGLLAAVPEKPPLERPVYDLTPKMSQFPGKAKAMISLFMSGGPSHHDLLDPKPILERYDGKIYPGDIQYDNNAGASKVVMASPFKFQQHGQSGTEVSELLPHLATIVDDITVIRSMNMEGIRNHVGGLRAMDSGRAVQGRPSLGSWLTYGLGSESQELPAFVALVLAPPPGGSYWSSGMLPSVYQGTHMRDQEPRLMNLDPPAHLAGAPQALQLSLLERLNQQHLGEHDGENDLQARIASYALAARMQTSARETLDIGSETKATLSLYGLDRAETRRFGEACLIARRLVERGVRFVQIWLSGWDHHENINRKLKEKCLAVDQPCTALVSDLKARGMLDTTLVHWGGEMGRLPVIQIGTGRGGEEAPGRDHNTDGFSMWLAGGGVKGGHVHGATDDFGIHAVKDIVHHYDYHATVLHLFGMDASRLAYKRNAREETILDGQPGQIVNGILA